MGDPMEYSEGIENGHITSLINGIANIVFEECIKSLISDAENCSIESTESYIKSFNYTWKKIYNQLDKEATNEAVKDTWTCSGKIGPANVGFNKNKSIGFLKFDDESLYVCSRDNFATVFGNACIYKGDTADSYAYDGNRQRKWNVSTSKYGDMWLCGDIISCLIDLDKGEISYLRNGHSLGVAFNNVKVGEGIAYFPAMSLAIDECLLVNFGASPFHYPVEGFQGLQRPPTKNLILAKSCLLWMVRIVNIHLNWYQYKELTILEEDGSGKKKKEVALLLIAHHIGESLSPLLECAYVVESTLIPMLDDMSNFVYYDTDKVNDEHLKIVHTFIDYLMSILQESELKRISGHIITCLQSYHGRVSPNTSYSYQKRSLKILCLLLSHVQFRKFCLKYILFVNCRLTNLVTLNCIDKANLKTLTGIDHYTSKSGEYIIGNCEVHTSAIEMIKKVTKEVEDWQAKVFYLLFTSSDATRYIDSSRALFLTKFRVFLMEAFDTRVTSVVMIPPQDLLNLFRHCFSLFMQLWQEDVGSLNEDALCPTIFFDGVLLYQDIHRLGGLESHLNKTFTQEVATALKENKKQMLFGAEAKLPEVIVHVNMECSVPSTSGAVLGGESVLLPVDELKGERLPTVDVTHSFQSDEKKEKDEILKTSLMHFLDNIILLYHNAAHKQTEKIVAQSDTFYENVEYLQELMRKKSSSQNIKSAEVLQELDRSISIMQMKLKEQSYQHNWNLATSLSFNSTTKLLKLLELVFGCLKNSSAKGPLFAFVPEFYVEVLTELCTDLKHLLLYDSGIEKTNLKMSKNKSKFFHRGGFDITSPIIDTYKTYLMKVGEFLAVHFCDSRILYADSKDSLIQALAGFVCHKPSLEALENMPEKSQTTMVRNLLQPYENRAWAQNNWILVRFWKGKGFGFRYTKSPHLNNRFGPKPSHCEIPNIIQSSEPCPSEVFLGHINTVLQDINISTPFLNSLINQLNWVFSEFIGMLQEIQNASNRPERIFIDSRQLRICATCFDLTLALLRVLEMVVSVSLNIFLDSARSNSQSLLTRLCQLICQILNRVSVGFGCFSHVVNLEIPGLETIHYFPILTAVVGILCPLLRDDIYDETSSKVATSALLSEASFQLSSLYLLVGGKGTLSPLCDSALVSPPQLSSELSQQSSHLLKKPQGECSSINELFLSPVCNCKVPKLCFRKYTDNITTYEMKMIVDMLHHLENASSSQMGIAITEEMDALCTICYARSPDARFEPCHHTSCVTCITHYLMNKSACFFCKKPIKEVVEVSTSKVVFRDSEKSQSPT